MYPHGFKLQQTSMVYNFESLHALVPRCCHPPPYNTPLTNSSASSRTSTPNIPLLLRMRIKQLFIVSVVALSNCFAQDPSQDSTWQIYREWDFTQMTRDELKRHWWIDPCDKKLFHGQHAEPQTYEDENVWINQKGLIFTAKKECIYNF